MDVFILKLSTERWNLRMESFRLNRLILIYLYYSWLHLYKEKRGTGQRPSRLNRCQKSILYAFFFPFSSRLFFYFSPGLPKWRGDVSISRFLWFYNLRVSWCYIFATWTRNCPGFQGPKTRLRKKWNENCLSLQVRKIKKIWIIEAKNIICLHQMVRKEWREAGQAGVLFLHCHFPQSVGPGTSHWVIYSLGFPIDQSHLPSIAEVLWFQMWAPSLGAVRIRSRALDLQHGSPGHFSNSCFLISPTWGFILEAFSSGRF